MPSARMARPRFASKRTASSLADRTRPGSVREAISQWGAVVLRVDISEPPDGVERRPLLHGALLEENSDAVVAGGAGGAVGIKFHQAWRRRRVAALARLAVQADRGDHLQLHLQLAGPRVQLLDGQVRLGRARHRRADPADGPRPRRGPDPPR